MTKLYKKLDSSKPRYKEINQETKNNTDWLRDAISSSIGIVNKAFETANPANDHSNGIDINNTNSNVSLISNNNSTVDLISRGYESDLNNQNLTNYSEKKVIEQQTSFKTNLESKAVESDAYSSCPIDNLTFSNSTKNRKSPNSHINSTKIQVDVHNADITKI